MTEQQQYQHLVVTTTHEDEAAARSLAVTLVRERLAACAQVHPLRSVYWWGGEVQDTTEWRVDLKTRAALVDRLTARIGELHAYETPEVIAVPITAGAPGYLAWLDAETAEPPAATADPASRPAAG
ncbi:MULTISPECIES: divalent-cation tolerance protein CutA [Kitasatospora]|uniref:Putative divalent ion tolerance protein n=1 Tax=Kitasatospora setae (strain ATCC 33774 / DSM 43861 / JCM 3304 / KCC A-0304 / NBRC 14216 / KM-6054) TaxID=452652 RepID=E4N130_KITSK|nr:divalent-cation tolerance protein CutA [Kitasatospora setae]BAJ31864.1 putative divalent ion tolerance protein [Kitasatospora setae KM-6054]